VNTLTSAGVRVMDVDAGGWNVMKGGNDDNLVSTNVLHSPEHSKTPNPFDYLDSFLKSNLDDIANLVLYNDFDWLHLNGGMERVGKTSFCFWLVKYLESKGLKFDWSPDLKNVFFIEKNLSGKLLSLPQHSIAVLDEGGEVLFSRNAMKRFQGQLIQTLFAYGAKNIVLIINIPNWRKVDVSIREDRVRSLTICKSKPKKALVENNLRFERERGFYRFFTRKQVLRATKFKTKLGTAMFAGHVPAFNNFYPKEWGWYKDRKEGFLKDKKAFHLREKEVQLPLVVRRVDAVETSQDLKPIMLK